MFEKGRRIRKLLFDLDLTQVWLINELRERGISTDKSEMSSVLKGTRKGDKAERILENSLEILKKKDGCGKEAQ